MSLRDVRFDILNIIDLNPLWIRNLNYNPVEAIVKHGKSHHLLTFLEDVYGFRKDNPVMSEIRYFHYKNPYVDTIFKDLKLKVIASIIAISSIGLLEAFVDTSKKNPEEIYLMIYIHAVFIVSGLLLALMDYFSSKSDPE